MFRNTTASDVAYVVEHMRPEDVREWWLSSGKPAVEAIRELGEKPYVSFTLGRGDEPIVIFGATIDPETKVATMFRFATERWPEVVREAVKIGRRLMIPLFKESGVTVLFANTLRDSDARWLELFGAEYTGGHVDAAGTQFKHYLLFLTKERPGVITLMDAPVTPALQRA